VPRVVITGGAARGLARCRDFLESKNPRAAARAGQLIELQFALLETSPDIGRPVPESPAFRELLISFGDSGYVALYRHEAAMDTVYIVAFRHQKQAGY